MLSLDSRNFHAWGYRRIIVATLKIHYPGSDVDSKSMAEQEFEYTTNMTASNLSNFSAWHNRSKLIPKLLDERRADNASRRNMLDEGISEIKAPRVLMLMLLQSLGVYRKRYGRIHRTSPPGSTIRT